ncbi:MAG: fructosamine kinase family protein [Candidatus Promineifilaceae bacterium]
MFELKSAVEQRLRTAVSRLEPLSGGSVASVYKVGLSDGTTMAAKFDQGRAPTLAIEGYMLDYLAEHSRLPVPKVFYCDNRLLLLEMLPGQSSFGRLAQHHAAELLADLHLQTAAAFGHERDTLIGGLHQPNPWSDSWIAFFRDQRLGHMAHQAAEAGRLPESVLARLDKFGAHLDRWLSEPEQPSLVHGDAWTGNILAKDGRITGFLDPAIYYADAEIELAFTTLFGTFGQDFFDRYEEIRPIRPGFREVRCDIYNLYPLLVHVRLFGGHYLGAVERILERFGY